MANEPSFHDLVPVKTREIGETTIRTVNARQLHGALLVGKDFSNWIKGRIDRFGFEEGRDYLVAKIGEQLPSGTKHLIDYYLSLDMAKEIAMVENNDRGRSVRRYFIECERIVREGIGMLGGEVDLRVIGGIVKSVVRKSLDDAIRERLPEMLAVAMVADPRVAAIDLVSVCELLDEAKALPKGRNSINRRIGNALRDICLRDGRRPPLPPNPDMAIPGRCCPRLYASDRHGNSRRSQRPRHRAGQPLPV